ncbi:alpha-amylase family glycosyl hydrolase [Algoriphagus sp. CAU 1675]|uniref:alpha-amylase family glycosyl hydrolase n=1 Tax=Algoriphagus sp. CAU 1675 TaxID=3032597 RepID=UPI0023DB8531|nr:alpha-amylase family glycosyl hydrolase [Algoriphagus sp. CAU 1675]MDF2158310.1 alpha-amylase family glycosyl hydrolase [Algoriphagus sp. CAU 1675]
MDSIRSIAPLLEEVFSAKGIDLKKRDKEFSIRFIEGYESLFYLFEEIYGGHHDFEVFFKKLIESIVDAYLERENSLRKRDSEKLGKGNWFLSNELAGMSLYVDRFCGNLKTLKTKLSYFEELGVNFLHLMPIFESPEGESDGGYAVSDFRKVDKRFGTLAELKQVRKKMHKQGMYLMLDIVLNHTSHRHEWAEKAKAGDPFYQDFFYIYENRWIPNQFETEMPEIFPESAPGNFTWSPECNQWVMTVFHSYQWDLNYRNPWVLKEMLENIFFYANLGVDLLRIDAPAFIWKESGTSCQNLPKAHTLLRLIKQAVQIATPGMALLGEAIVAPKEIMKYFGTEQYTARECDFAYNATQMALQWDMLASGETKVMLAAQNDILQKPFGTSWITYTRCHDDIGLGYDDWMIKATGKDPYLHRSFLKDYYSGKFPHSPAKGALFSSNPKTGDARISGSMASLCGLEKALEEGNSFMISQSVQKILMMQAHAIFLGGLPMLFYGDELGLTNDYSYLHDPGKSYDNRWMHRPIINWEGVEKRKEPGTVENKVFEGTQRLLQIRKKLPAIGDYKNIVWMSPHNIHVAGYLRSLGEQRIYCVFNFGSETALLTWYAFKEQGVAPSVLYDHWTDSRQYVGLDNEYLVLEPYGFRILEVVY